jgi:hypothetical protein
MENVPQKYLTLLSIKFLFSIIRGILILCIFFTFDENIFSGLNYYAERGDLDYLIAKSV